MQKWLNEDLPMQERVEALISAMTVEEKVSQLTDSAAGLARLGIRRYNWWNEALHGVARAGIATVFPQAIGLAATWNPALIAEVADAISTEARAKYNEAQRQNNSDRYYGLTFWSPNINIYRDPRWGRGHETYGEDPFLTASIAKAFIGGLQGHSKHLKTAACVKHFAAHSGPETGREAFNSEVSEKDLWETYLPAFEKCIREAGVEAVMGAYNAFEGIPCCCNEKLLTDILRKKWNFSGHVVSDCGAIHNITEHHHYTKDPVHAAALALKSGCDLNCGTVYEALTDAYEMDLVTDDDLDNALKHTLAARFKLGMFDSSTEYDHIPMDVVACDAHKALSEQTARESLVLLKNDGILPLNRETTGTVALIGPNADNKNALLGNYNGEPSSYFTVYDGFCHILGNHRVEIARGCNFFGSSDNALLDEAVKAAKAADVCVLVLGLDATFEGEAGDANNPFGAGDRPDIELPKPQEELLEKICAVSKRVIVVMLSGGATALCYADTHAQAILQCWYPGECGGNAIADLIFGEYSPSGKLPVTFYRSTADLPDFSDYSMNNRTYRYFNGSVLYPFGWGLSYTSFRLSVTKADEYHFCIKASNCGNMDSSKVIMLFVSLKNRSNDQPIRQLAAFEKVYIPAHSEVNITMELEPDAYSLIDSNGNKILQNPDYFNITIC